VSSARFLLRPLTWMPAFVRLGSLRPPACLPACPPARPPARSSPRSPANKRQQFLFVLTSFIAQSAQWMFIFHF